VSSIRGRSSKRKRLKVGLDFRYAQPEDHLTEFVDRGIPPPEQSHKGQNGSEQSLNIVLGNLV
jgi:hypothetical protein